MQIMIDIPEILFEKIQNRKADKQTLETVIICGTSLPKGHGDLKDTDAISHELMDEYYGMISDSEMKIYKIMRMLDNAPTIIEADKEK